MNIKKFAGLAGASMLAFTTAACGNSGFDGTCERGEGGLSLSIRTNDGQQYTASVQNEFGDTAHARTVRDRNDNIVPNATASLTRSDRMCHMVKDAQISSYRLIK